MAHGGELDRPRVGRFWLVGTWLARNRNLNRNKPGSFRLLARDRSIETGEESFCRFSIRLLSVALQQPRLNTNTHTPHEHG